MTAVVPKDSDIKWQGTLGLQALKDYLDAEGGCTADFSPADQQLYIKMQLEKLSAQLTKNQQQRMDAERVRGEVPLPQQYASSPIFADPKARRAEIMHRAAVSAPIAAEIIVAHAALAEAAIGKDPMGALVAGLTLDDASARLTSLETREDCPTLLRRTTYSASRSFGMNPSYANQTGCIVDNGVPLALAGYGLVKGGAGLITRLDPEKYAEMGSSIWMPQTRSWEYFYRGDATFRSAFLSKMAQDCGTVETQRFLDGLPKSPLSEILSEHAVTNSGSPFVSSSRNISVAEYYARGRSQMQEGVVTIFRIEAQEAKLLQSQGKLVPNFENPVAFFEPNPLIGLPESEFLFAIEIDPRFIYRQVPVRAK